MSKDNPINIKLTPVEVRCIIWHLEYARKRGTDDATANGLRKLKQALKEQDAPLFAEVAA